MKDYERVLIKKGSLEGVALMDNKRQIVYTSNVTVDFLTKAGFKIEPIEEDEKDVK